MVCVLGYKIADELFADLPAVGKAVKIEGKSFIVVGVLLLVSLKLFGWLRFTSIFRSRFAPST